MTTKGTLRVAILQFYFMGLMIKRPTSPKRSD